MSEVSVDLPALASSVPTARQFVRRTLVDWSRSNIVEAAALLTSELVTNAVQHSRPAGHGAKPIELRMRPTRHGVRIEVDDACSIPPVQRDATDNGGRGLIIVDTLSTAWGTHANDVGKTVWFELEQP